MNDQFYDAPPEASAAPFGTANSRRKLRRRSTLTTRATIPGGTTRCWAVGRSHPRRYSWAPLCALALFAADRHLAWAHHGYGALLPKTTVAAPTARVEDLASLPTSMDLTPWTVPVGDQGSLGSCVAWTIAHDLMGWYARRQGISPTLFAPMYMYSQYHAPEPPGGMYTSQGFLAASQQGNDSEADYSQGDYDYWDTPTAAERANAAHYRISGFSTLMATGGEGGGLAGQAAIQTALAVSQPVAIGLRVRAGFEYLGYGQIDTDTTSSVFGYHEVLAVGYDASGLKIQNHWGTGWGTNGFGVLSWAVVQQDIIEARMATSIAACQGIAVDPLTLTFPAGSSASRSATIKAPAACMWTITNANGWLGVSAASGIGSATVTFTPVAAPITAAVPILIGDPLDAAQLAIFDDMLFADGFEASP